MPPQTNSNYSQASIEEMEGFSATEPVPPVPCAGDRENTGLSRAKAYTDSGVNLVAGNALVERIKSVVAKTRTLGVISDIGGFGGLFRPDLVGMDDPVLVSSTDGVGTKLKFAFAFDKHDTVGIDLVAMSVNDILVQGARPLFFLDYFATGCLDVDKAQHVIEGIVEGCKQAQCALLGGETAEMPSMYAAGEYDLAGFCVGIVDNAKIVDGSSIRLGQKVVGIASSGLHSNGFSLVRKLFEASKLQGDDIFPGTTKRVSEVLLEPTIIYVDIIRNILRDVAVAGMVHITGGGFYDNIARILPGQVVASVDFGVWDIPPVFHWIKELGNLTWPEMLQIFNCGIGYVLVVDSDVADEVVARIRAMHCGAWVMGSIEKRHASEVEGVRMHFQS